MEEAAKEKLRKTFAAKRARGESTGRAPLGYAVVYDETGRFGRLVEDPDVMPLVLEARRMRQEGHSIRAICRVMYAKGLLTRKGTPLRPMDVWRLVKSSETVFAFAELER